METPLKTKFNDLIEKIDILNYISIKLDTKINKIKNENIINEYKSFKYNYKSFTKLKRFLIPVFGKISCGKSTLLNYILNLYDTFETNYNISTKFICIIRHNKLLKVPKIYNACVIERGEYIHENKTIKLWNFEKGDEIIGDIKTIIENRNHELNKLEFRDSHWEKYFMILETNIPLFNGENEIYSEFFEFMDVPGLNEFNKGKDSEHFYFKELLPFFIYNVGFSLYIFDAEKQESEDSITIINYILYTYFNSDLNKQKNCIFILNKIDKVNNEESELNKLKKNLNKNLICHIEEEGYFIGLSSLLLYLNRFKYNSFFDYLFCIIQEYNSQYENDNIDDYIIKRMLKDFQINKMKENLEITSNKTLSIKQRILLKKLNDKIIEKGFNSEFTEVNYIYYNKYFEKYSKNKKEQLGEKHNKLESIFKKSFKNTIDNFLNNFKYENLINDLVKQLGIKEEEIRNIKLEKKKTFNLSKLNDPISFVKSFKKILDSLNKMEPNSTFIKTMNEEYETTLLYMNKEKKIRIILLGEYSSGKSSLLNTLIGNNLNILPIDTKVCTNIGLVIRYTKNISNIFLYHTSLKSSSNDYYYFQDENFLAEGIKLIKPLLILLNSLFASSKYSSQIQKKIIDYFQSSNFLNLDEEFKVVIIYIINNILNDDIDCEYDFLPYDLQKLIEEIIVETNEKNIEDNNNFYERVFFLLTVPIYAFDLISLPDNLKEKIELIDFPGLDSINNIFNSNVLSPLLKCTDGFIFVNKGNIINEQENVNMLYNIIDKIQMRKFEFSFQSCLFIDLDESKKEYESILEIQKREQNWNDIISKEKILKHSDKINITKFSNIFYSKFKDFQEEVNNYSKFMEHYESNIDKNLNNNTYLKKLRKDIYNIVCSISSEMYNDYHILINIDIYKKRFQKYMNDNENIKIIEDIIKMYLFIKDYIYKSKFYINSNAKDFFPKFKKELISSKDFYNESLKGLAMKYLFKLYENFELMQMKILGESINVKFTKDDFIETKKKIELKYEEEKEEIKKNINNTINSMKNEYDLFVDNLKNGKFESYEDLLTKTKNKIEEHKKNLEKKINNEIPKFRENLLKELPTIKNNKHKLSKIYEGNLSSYGMFKSIYNAEEIAQNIFLYGANALNLIELGLLGISTISISAAEGVAVAATQLGGAFISLGSLLSFAIGGLLGIAIPLTIKGGFSLYKKLVEKKKYIELIQNAKKELEKSLQEYEKKIIEILDTIKDSIQEAVKMELKNI